MGNHRFLKLVYDRRRKNSNGFRGPENERSPLFVFSELSRVYLSDFGLNNAHNAWLKIIKLKSTMFKIFQKSTYFT